MSDIKVGDKFKVTNEFMNLGFPLEYSAVAVPDKTNPYLIMEYEGSQYGFTIDEVEKIEPESRYKFVVGDKVLVTCEYYTDELTTLTGTVLFVDKDDEGLPYRIAVEENDTYGDWFTFAEVSEYTGEQTPERADHTALVQDADSLIFAYGITDPSGFTIQVLKRLRDALVDESYREGN